MCNATGLVAPPDGLEYPPSSLTSIPSVCRPRSEGGQLYKKGQVEVLSSLERDGRQIPDNIRWGVFVVFEGDTEYVRRCFTEYGMVTDREGRYGALYKRWHLIGLELGISVASVGLRGEPTGCAVALRADATAVAKRDLKPSEILDGEGGYTVVGKLLPAETSLAIGALPLGLTGKVKVLRPVKKGMPVTWHDVEVDATLEAVKARRELEASLNKDRQAPAILIVVRFVVCSQRFRLVEGFAFRLSIGFLLADFPSLDDASLGEKDLLELGSPILLATQQKFEIHPEMLELFLLCVPHDGPRRRILFN